MVTLVERWTPRYFLAQPTTNVSSTWLTTRSIRGPVAQCRSSTDSPWKGVPGASLCLLLFGALERFNNNPFIIFGCLRCLAVYTEPAFIIFSVNIQTINFYDLALCTMLIFGSCSTWNVCRNCLRNDLQSTSLLAIVILKNNCQSSQ